MSDQKPAPLLTRAGSGVGRATGFEPASRRQPNAANIERNRTFAADVCL